jgi:hypothetical protein
MYLISILLLFITTYKLYGFALAFWCTALVSVTLKPTTTNRSMPGPACSCHGTCSHNGFQISSVQQVLGDKVQGSNNVQTNVEDNGGNDAINSDAIKATLCDVACGSPQLDENIN